MESRLGSQPTTARRGVPSDDGATSAWISTSSGRVPSMPAKTAVPGWPRSRSDKEELGRIGDLLQSGAGHLEDADLVGRAEAVLHGAQDAELVRALALEREHGIDHVLDDAGPGDLAVLGDVADEDDGRAASAWRSGSAPAPSRAPASPCRALNSTAAVHMVWIESMTMSRGVLPSDSVAMMSSTAVSAASSTAAPRKAQPLGAQAHLRHGLLAGDVDDAVAGARQRCGGLDQQRRLADAGIARHQQHRAAHQAAAGDAVEFGKCRDGRRGASRASPVSGSSANRRPLAGLAARPGGRAPRLPRTAYSTRRRPRICPASGVAGRAAVLADEGKAAFGHGNCPRNGSRTG